MLRPHHKRRSGLFGSSSFNDDDDDANDDDDEEEEESDESDVSAYADTSVDGDGFLITPTVAPTSFGGLFGFSSRCRLCPGYIAPPVPSGVLSGACASSCSEGTVSSRSPPDYTCTPRQRHVLCQCCLQPMPENWPDSVAAESIPLQKCAICSKYFCHLLWGCRKPGCLGCLNEFKDFQFAENILLSLINNNTYESNILKDFLTEQSLSKDDLLQKCLQKLDSKEYTTIDTESHDLSSSTVVCYKCGLRNFQELAYQFRRNIPRDQLPDSVHSRDDCYWGKNCRTQKTKPLHASRFNHICEQTRFT